MQQFTFTLFLDYLYNRFALTFVLCIIGSIIRILINASKERKSVSISKVLASTMFSTVLMCALSEFIPFTFTVYVLVCVLIGMWNQKILHLFLDSKFMTKLLENSLKTIAGPVSDIIEDTISDTQNNKENKKVDIDTKDEKAENAKDKKENG